MPYTVHFSNRDVVVQPGTIDSSTNINLIGRYVTNYGQIVAQDLANLLQNFASNTAPDKAKSVPGQLWYNTVDSSLYMFDAVNWTKISADTRTESIGKTVGENIMDTNGTSHGVLSSYVGTLRYSILSPDPEFTPKTAITGFNTIKTGLNLASTLPTQGTSANAELLHNLPYTSYMRTDTNTGTSGSLAVTSNAGVFLGTHAESQINYFLNDLNIKNVQADGRIVFQVSNHTNQPVTPLTVLGNSEVQITGNLRVVQAIVESMIATEAYSKNLYATNLYVRGTAILGNVANVHITGGSQGQVLTTDGTGNLTWTDNAGGDVPFPFGDLGVAVADFPNLGAEIPAYTVYDCATMPRTSYRLIDLGNL